MTAEWEYLVCKQYLETKNMSHALLRLRDRGHLGRPLALPHPESVLLALKKYLRIAAHLQRWPRDRLKYRFDQIQHHVRRIFAFEKRKGFRLQFVPRRAQVLYNTLLSECIKHVTSKLAQLSTVVSNI